MGARAASLLLAVALAACAPAATPTAAPPVAPATPTVAAAVATSAPPVAASSPTTAPATPPPATAAPPTAAPSPMSPPAAPTSQAATPSPAPPEGTRPPGAPPADAAQAPSAPGTPSQAPSGPGTPSQALSGPGTLTAAATLPERPLACGAVIRESLKLANDLACPKDALTVAAPGVTLDLNGKTITGPGPGTPTWPQPNLQSVGIRVAGQSEVTIRNGNLHAFSSAILLENVKSAIVEQVDAQGNYYGIYLRASERNTIRDSSFTGNVYGPTLYEAHANRLERNQMSRQTHFSPGGYGIYIYGSRDNQIVDNTIDSNVNWGIWLSSSQNNTFARNNVIKNSPQVSDDGGANNWHDPARKEGNYWADWEGQELPGTGIGNHPYLIWGPGNAVDPFPFVRRDGWKEPNRRPPAGPAAAPAVATRAADRGGAWVSLPDARRVAAASADGAGLDRDVRIGRLASNVAWSADGGRLYMVDGAPPIAGLSGASAPLLLTVDARTGTVLRADPVAGRGGLAPTFLIADRDGRHLHLLDGAAVVTLDLTEGLWAQPLAYPAEVAAAFASWKHELLLVANRRARGVDLVWIGGRRISYTIPVGGGPTALVANRAGTRLYVAVAGQSAIPVIETEQYAIVDRLEPGPPERGWLALATAPDGATLFGLQEGGDLVALALPSGALRYRRALGPGLSHLAAAADGARLFAAGSAELLTLSAADGSPLARAALPAPAAELLAAP